MDASERAARRRMLRKMFGAMHRAADRAIARFAPGGRVPTRAGGTGTTQGAEPPLGNPAADGYILSSTTAGARAWVPDAGGDAVLGGDGAIPSLFLPAAQEGGTVGEVGRWVRQGTILSPALSYENTAVQEPSVVVADDEIKLFYTAGWGSPALALATCPLTSDPTVAGNWTKQGKVLGQGASGEASEVAHHGVFLIDGTYHAYFTHASAASALYVSTSADGLTWGAKAVAIAANQVAWADWWVNPMVWREGDAWLMLLEGRLGSGTWFMARATSTDGLAWTIQGAGPLTDLQVTAGGAYSGPWLPFPEKRDGLYQLWFHAAAAAANLPSNIHRATSPDLITWTLYGGGPVLTHTGSSPEVDQVADPCVVEIFGRSYLFYDALDNPSSASVIRVASIDATLAQVVDEAPRLGADLSPSPAGTYTSATVTVDSQGRVTAAANGVAGLTTEQVQDIVGALVVAGPGATITYDDPGATLTFATAETFGPVFTNGGDFATRNDGSLASKRYVL